MEDFKFYEVGDELLGITNKDVDYLHDIPRLRDYIFERTNLWLKPTNEK